MTRIHYRQQDDLDASRDASARYARVPTETSRTQQSFAEDADINVLVARFGLDPNVPPPEAFDARYYGDMTEVPDLRTALETVRDAQTKFRKLSPRLRERFANDPAKLWQFVNDPENLDEAVRLGLLKRQPTTEAPTGPAGASAAPNPSSTPSTPTNGPQNAA